MKTIRLIIQSFFLLFLSITVAQAQLPVKVVSGQIFLSGIAPSEVKYKSVTDSLDRKLKLNPNDTTFLYYRAVLYLVFNSLIAKPDLTSNEPTDKLLIAKKPSDRADSLKMKSLDLKILSAQICKELTYRYAPAESWRFNAAQMAARKKKFDYYKDIANQRYEQLATLDKRNAYDYQRLKIK